jgi:hypothetical protein
MNARNPPTAADSWTEGEAVTRDRAEELLDVLEAHPDYEVRPAVQVKHDDSAVVKTIDTLDNAESTLADFRYDIMFSEPPWDELTDEQIELLSGHEFAEDSREEVRQD